MLPSIGREFESPSLRHWSRVLLAGAGAGVAATAAMSAVMFGFQKLGLLGRMPPRHIVEDTLARFRVLHRTSPAARKALSTVSHLGFGATQGMLYAAALESPRVLRQGTATPQLRSGVPFALLVWAASYAGWLPKLGILPPPSRDRFGRPTSMIIAHAVYGAVLAELLRRSPGLRG
jgi:hypothetical protein